MAWIVLCYIHFTRWIYIRKGCFFFLEFSLSVAYPVGAYLCFCSMKKCGFSFVTECHLFVGYPTPHYCIRLAWQSAGTQSHSWVEGGTVIVKCFAQELNTMTRPGLEPAPLVPASRVTIIRPPRFQQRFWKIFQMRTKLESFVWNVFSEYGSLFNENNWCKSS